jgi:hypothetical protein
MDDFEKFLNEDCSFDSSPKELASIHEAGHAIIYHLLNHRIDSINVDDNGDGIVNCRIYTPRTFINSPEFLDIEMYNYGLICFSGYIAESKFSGLVLDIEHLYNLKDVQEGNDFTDYRDEMEFVNYSIDEEKFDFDYFEYIYGQTIYLINNDLIWEAITKLSEELNKTKDGGLSGDKTHWILNEYIPRENIENVYGIPFDYSFMKKKKIK